MYLVLDERFAQEGALLRLGMHPLGGHVIRRLPGFCLTRQTSIPETPLPLLPLPPDLDVSNGGQDARSILHGLWHNVMCVSHLPYHGQSKKSRLMRALIPISKGDMLFSFTPALADGTANGVGLYCAGVAPGCCGADGRPPGHRAIPLGRSAQSLGA